jgi:Winged helix DNA-binding domain
MAGAVRRVGVQERRARLALRHHLAPAARAADPVEATRGVVGLHATDPASVFLAAAARTRAPTVAAVERALYEDRLLLRMLGMRRTMFVVPVELAPVVHAACTQAIAATQRRLTVQLLARSGIAGDPGRWLEEVEAATLKALEARGAATAAELTEDEPRLRHQVHLAEGKSYASRQNITTRVLLQLAADGRIVRGRPRGSWISSQYRWSPVDSWLPGGMASWPADAAQAELVRRWLAAFGPGTAADLKWWTGLTAGQVKRALAAVGAVEVDLDGVPGLLLPDDLEPPPGAAEPWVALLPALDPTVMGWSGRGWYLGEHGRALFDRNGNAGPTVWWDGRIVGGWAQRRDGEVAVRLLEDVGADAAAAVEAAAARLRAWLGAVRVTPRFRTPLERELSA